jgi:CheY-like chemotaxis protein
MLLRSVRRLLPEYEIVCVESAKKALALLDAGRPFDLIVSDVMMPEMSGIEFFHQLSYAAPDHVGRLVFLTGGAFTQQARDFLSSVARPQLQKPFSERELRRAIDSVRASPEDPGAPG